MLSQIVARTEGVPLFVEEVTKAVLELGVLVEQVDRFEPPVPCRPTSFRRRCRVRWRPSRSTGPRSNNWPHNRREFGYELLSTVAEDDQTDLKVSIGSSTQSCLPLGDSPEETYLFKHALIRDAAYQSLLRKSRRALHERIAEALTSRFPETATLHPELVAEHYSAAGRADQAVTNCCLPDTSQSLAGPTTKRSDI